MLINTILPTLAVLAFCVGQAGKPATPAKQDPCFAIACNISTLTEAERKEMPKLAHRLIDAKPTVKTLTEGYELHFAESKGLFPAAARWLSLEQQCCSFFEFSLSVGAGNGPMTLRISGPSGTKAFIDNDMPLIHKLAGGA